ncbi:MAG: hypothetical protein CVV21_01835 [Candidatus Goldiibacteriota bacterium HGW-Goldbacteria-1]|nr:MAG: hypothetical protein CVV21_01835 [Candidatus Goldiibacteriota bacterium HGW-Goldbacteria-1]
MAYLKYRGTISHREILRELEEELADISSISGWKYQFITENFHTMSRKTKNTPEPEEITGPEFGGEIRKVSSAEVYLDGISLFIDHGNDPLTFSFDKNGSMATVSMQLVDDPLSTHKITVKKYEFMYSPYIKMFTRNAEHHIKAVKVLDYIKKKYVTDLEVIDTTMYWETRDEEELKVIMWKSAGKNRQISI